MPHIITIFAYVYPLIDFEVVFLDLNVIPIHSATKLFMYAHTGNKHFIANFVEVLR